MPIYEYRCEACGQRFERWQKISEPPATTCAACGKRRARRLISATSFVLKGTGWYATDYQPKGARSEGGEGKEKGGSKGEGAAA